MKNLIVTGLIAFGLTATASAQVVQGNVGLCAAPDSEAAKVMPEPMDFGSPEALSVETANGTHVFSVDIADTPAKQQHGMMFRTDLPADSGMLFEFAAPKVSGIWMRNTYASLDVIFVRKNGKILKIVHNAKPCSLRSMSSEAVVAAVLEIPGGRAQALGIVPGDTVIHDFFGTSDAK